MTDPEKTKLAGGFPEGPVKASPQASSATSNAEHPEIEQRQEEEHHPPEEQEKEPSGSERLPDTFAEFIADGDAQTSPTNFLSGLFKKATETIESSLNQAQQTSTEAINNAQTAGSSAFTAVTHIVRDIGNGLADPAGNFANAPATIGFAASTRSIKSFRVPPPPLFLLSPNVIVCSGSICTISEAGKVLEQSIAPEPTNNEAVDAISVARLSNSSLILGLRNGSLRVLSIAGPVPAVVRESEGSRAVVLRVGDNVVAVGTQHGDTNVLNASDLSLVKTIAPPILCVAQLGAAMRHAPVSSLALSKDAFVLIGYEDGAVKFSSTGDDLMHRDFVAHSRRVSGVLLFYDVLAVTIGGGEDPSLAVFDAHTGRCLVRRMLPYTPHSLQQNQFYRACNTDVVCPSEMNFMVGGTEGQVELFRLIVLSPDKVEIQLINTFSGRTRGKNRAVTQVAYVPENALLLAMSTNGEVKRWHVSMEDGCNMALLDAELSHVPTITEENVVSAADQDLSLPDGSRLNAVSGVIKAQNILAAMLDEERIPETEKDRLVSDFQRCQADMLVSTSQGDTELRRARRRIVSRFEGGLRAANIEGTPTSVQLSKAAKRTAAFEIDFASRRHIESLDRVQKSTIAGLKSILQGLLKRLPSTVCNSLEEIKMDVESLGRENTESV